MTLISMLIALIIERLAVRSDVWQFSFWWQRYQQLSNQGGLKQLIEHRNGVLVWWLLPALLVSLLVYILDFWLFQLAGTVVVLLLCIGCLPYRQLYKQYLNAAQREDKEAMDLCVQQMALLQGTTSFGFTTGQQLVWLNFRYYAAVMFWFAVLGVFGAVAYASLRLLSEPRLWSVGMTDTQEQTSEDAPALIPDTVQTLVQSIGHWADVIPVRLYGLGLALVGDFSKTSQCLMQQGSQWTKPNSELLAELVYAAEPVAEDQRSTVEEAIAMVQLGKRNQLFFLALVAVLTLSGWLG